MGYITPQSLMPRDLYKIDRFEKKKIILILFYLLLAQHNENDLQVYTQINTLKERTIILVAT